MAEAKAMRKYQAGIERALALFDATNEWADYIAFLSRLLKSLQGPPENADIPLKSTIARHLAQCLRPSLPSGVHQKALEVYATIFSVIGSEKLCEDLPLYLPGLSHTLSFASLSTRPQFLALYDDYVLVLPPRVLRPAIRAIIMSLLPGIEEEASEDFDKTLATFNRLRDIFIADFHEEVFWQNLFLASITSPNRRAGALVYLNRYLPKLTSTPPTQQENGVTQSQSSAVKAVTSPEAGLLVRCFATGLQDSQPLIQRGFLDILVSHLPLDASIFADTAHVGDLDVLVVASVAIVLRRDMGLNRRLWAWYTGSEAKGGNTLPDTEEANAPGSPSIARSNAQSSKYFSTYGLASLVRSISSMLKDTSPEPSQRARPFRIALSLMDRWEIGGPVVRALFVPLLENLQLYQATAPSQEAFDEVFRSANVFFDGVESKLIASQLLRLIQNKNLDLVIFIVSNFNLEEEDMMRIHIPLICRVIVGDIRHLLTQPENENISSNSTQLAKLGQIFEDLLVLVPAGVLRDIKPQPSDSINWKINVFQQYSTDTNVINGSDSEPTLDFEALSGSLLEDCFECLQQLLSAPFTNGDLLGRMLACMDQCIALIDGLHTLRRISVLPKLLENIRSLNQTHDGMSNQVIVGITSFIATLHSRDPLQDLLKNEDLCSLIPALVEKLWLLLIASGPQHHVEAVESIWRLHSISRHLRLVDSTILSLVVEELGQNNSREPCMQRFGTLWIHSRMAAKQFRGLEASQNNGNDDILDLLQHPLLQIIDITDMSEPTHPCLLWIRSLTSLSALFTVVFQQMPKDMKDTSSMSNSLQRLRKLIAIAKGNETQWKAFGGKTGQGEAVLELCSSLTSNQAVIDSLGIEALQIVRLLIGSEGFELGDDILRMLSTRLVGSSDIANFQDSLLDTLQAAFSSVDPPSQPDYLIPILLDGIASPVIDSTLDKWITLLCTITPLLGSSSLFSSLLKITSCLCKRAGWYFDSLQVSYNSETGAQADLEKDTKAIAAHPERSISNLLSGMEYVLARAHHEASLSKREQGAGVNGTVGDLPSSRSSANDHLTVVLCIQDALKMCVKLSLWRSTGKTTSTTIDTKSLHYMTSRLRARSRRILENLIEAEPQECLETLMGIWVEKRMQNLQHHQVLELLQTLDGARPKFMMPATFNAIYNRTNPGALHQSQRSSLSVSVNAFELIAFLNDYTAALEDDLLDEIWTDCTAFLKEILSNPMPHRQILFKLLEFTAVLCRKMENTNFGEESRMRKELADLCNRLFIAIFTTKPQGFDGTGAKSSDVESVFDHKRSFTRSSVQPENALQILQDTLPDLALVLTQSDRLITVYNGIATNITGPLLHSKQYPQNMSAELLVLLQTMSTAPAAMKAWRKDVFDAFNDAKFFQNEPDLVELGWLPLIRQLALTDKAIMTELLLRLTPPATAGIMFGVGASAARAEADKRTQASLRRVGLLLLSTEIDYSVPNLQLLLMKLEELLTATPETSPSSNSRADVYLIIRTILLTFSQTQLASLWPIVDSELRDLCTAMVTKDFTKFTLTAQMQGAKLLDVLLLMKPDEFQLHEWLFVTDTMDAVHPSVDMQPVALADQITLQRTMSYSEPPPAFSSHLRKPWLCTEASRDSDRAESLLAGFFTDLSIRSFEDSYSLQRIDIKACRDDLLKDLFSD